ncbi:probable mRNA transport regulator MTR10 at N-terminal half [Coccomyxa sp. Obi]|nr:probable mRNA transport regulator MTR10 at N-terminal half [Coccomyxa sp. Obi]
MSEMQELLQQAQQITAAVQELNSPATSPAERRAADDFLADFQKHPAAWKVLYTLVCSTNMPAEAVIFAAQSFRRKVQRQLSSIVSGLYPDLLHKLTECIKFASKHTPAAVPSLAAALASMAVQWTEWNNPLETLGAQVPNTALLEFMKALPHECTDTRYAAQGASVPFACATQRFLDEAKSRALRYSGIVGAVTLEALKGRNPVWALPIPLVLDCLDAWVRFGLLHETREPNQASLESAQSPQLTVSVVTSIFTLAVKAMQSEESEIYSSAGTLVADMVEHAPEDMLSLFFESMSLLPSAAKQALEAGQVDRAGMMCHTFGGYCSSSIACFTYRSEEGEQLRRGLLACTQLAADDLPESGEPVASSSMVAWSDIAACLLEAQKKGLDLSDPRYLNWQEVKELYVRAMTTIVPLLAGPSYNGGSEDEALCHSPIASTAKDTLQHCCMMLGPQTYITILRDISTSSVGDSAWQRMEGVMFGLQAAEEEIGQFLEEEEGPHVEQAAQLLQQLLNDCANTRTSCAAQPIAASRLSLAMLEPLSRLVSPLLVCLKNKPPDAQGLLISTLNMAAACCKDPKVARVASSCMLQACEGALNIDMDIPQTIASGLLTAIQDTDDPEVEQDLVVALADCLSTGSNVAHQERVVSQELQAVHDSLEALSNLYLAGGTTNAQGSNPAAIERSAIRALRQTSWLLQQAGTFNGQGRPAAQDEEDSHELKRAAEGSMAATVVRGFVKVWPKVCEVVSQELPGAAEQEELRRLAARCATLAMQANAADFLSVLANLTAAAAAAFDLPGGENFASSLAVALTLYSGQPGAMAYIVAALINIAGLPSVAALRGWIAGDRNPDMALAVLTLAMTAAHSCPEDMTLLSLFLCNGLAYAVANIPCHNKDVFSTALSCADALVGVCKVPSGGTTELRKTLYGFGPELMVALVTGLIGPSALARVHRTASIICNLMEAMAPVGTPDPHTQLLRLLSWLTDAAEGLAMESKILPADAQLLQSRVGALLESAHTSVQPPESGRGLLGSEIGRRMKAELRAFVDIHQSRQF